MQWSVIQILDCCFLNININRQKNKAAGIFQESRLVFAEKFRNNPEIIKMFHVFQAQFEKR